MVTTAIIILNIIVFNHIKYWGRFLDWCIPTFNSVLPHDVLRQPFENDQEVTKWKESYHFVLNQVIYHHHHRKSGLSPKKLTDSNNSPEQHLLPRSHICLQLFQFSFLSPYNWLILAYSFNNLSFPHSPNALGFFRIEKPLMNYFFFNPNIMQ